MNDQTITIRGVSNGFGRATADMKLVSVQVGRPRTVQWQEVQKPY